MGKCLGIRSVGLAAPAEHAVSSDEGCTSPFPTVISLVDVRPEGFGRIGSPRHASVSSIRVVRGGVGCYGPMPPRSYHNERANATNGRLMGDPVSYTHLRA